MYFVNLSFEKQSIIPLKKIPNSIYEFKGEVIIYQCSNELTFIFLVFL